jgi:hypothetical protein
MVEQSAIGPWPSALHMSAFGGKADIRLRRSAFSVAIGAKADMACCSAYVCL